jgi:hypothetical protein
MYVMHRTTVHLPDGLRGELALAAKRLRRSEATLIREALAAHLGRLKPAEPRLPLFESGKPDLADDVEEALRGFGER